MTYDKDFLQEIESAVDLVEYAKAQGFEFRERQGNYWTSCPLHQDDTPSLAIRKEDGFMKCFSCGLKGKIISWLCHIERMSFQDAVQKAANLAGKELSAMCSSETVLFNKRRASKTKKDSVQHPLLPESSYDRFDLVQPQAWVDEGILPEVMKIFDIRYDAGSSRIVYPVRMLTGGLVGIKGRSVLSADTCKALGIAKYMNYNKIQTTDFFQSLDKTIPYVEEKREIILFEGIKSCMKAFGWGYKNTAAVEGHCLNHYQVRLLIQLGFDVTVAFDSDVIYSDSQNAALREALDTLSRFLNVYVVVDKKGVLGGTEARNSPVDCGKEVWGELYESRERWDEKSVIPER